MIICICNGITSAELEDAIEKDAVKDLFRDRYVDSSCGTCIPVFKERLSALSFIQIMPLK